MTEEHNTNKENIITISAEADDAGSRLDLFLSSALDDMSRSSVQKLIENEHVMLNGEVCTAKKRKIEAGDKAAVTIPPPEVLDIIAEDIPLKIVYEDDDRMVIDKTKGMVVHPGTGNMTGTVVNAIMFHCKDRLSSINGVERPGIVHRIDKDTSGLLMIAKTDRAHRSLAAQLKEHSITRAYKAVVYNNFKEDEGRIDLPLGRHPTNRMKQAVTDVNARRAVTNYKVLERFGRFTLIEARLETGRTHQIRVHMSYMKHPLLGDEVYGPSKNPYGVHGQMLHAYLLGFEHPVTGEYMEFESPLPDEFEKLLKVLRQQFQ